MTSYRVLRLATAARKAAEANLEDAKAKEAAAARAHERHERVSAVLQRFVEGSTRVGYFQLGTGVPGDSWDGWVSELTDTAREDA